MDNSASAAGSAPEPRGPVPATTPDALWEAGAAQLRTQLAEATWHAWFQGVRALRFDGDVLVLGVPSTVAC